MEEDPLEELEGRMKRGFRVGFNFIKRLRQENETLEIRAEILEKRVEMLEKLITNLRRTGDN